MRPNANKEQERPPLPWGEGVVPVVGAAIFARNRCLVALRKPGGSAGGKWEFPGGKVEPGEGPRDALVREILEELDCHIEVHEWIARGVFQPDERMIVLDVYRCTLIGEEPKIPGEVHDSILWCDSTTLPALDWATADVPIVPKVVSLMLTTNESTPSKPHG